MKTNKGFGVIGIIIAIIAVLAVGVAYYAGKKSNPIKPAVKENRAPEIVSDVKEFKNDELGFSFSYPSRYGNIILNVVQRDPGAQGPFNELRQYPNGFGSDIFNLRYFSAYFSNTKDMQFGGGVECTGCEGGSYFGDAVFQGDQSDYEKFYTNTGELGLLYRGTTKAGEPCDILSGCLYEGDIIITFKVNTDYRGITFYAKDTLENIAILKSLAIKR